MAEYAHPESLVDTGWVARHGTDANVRLVEVDVDTSAYEQGHIVGDPLKALEHVIWGISANTAFRGSNICWVRQHSFGHEKGGDKFGFFKQGVTSFVRDMLTCDWLL
jgi:hypothetical protein